MPDSDTRGVGGHEPPPPTSPMMAAGAALGFDIAALIAILLDKCDIATILLIIGILFGGWVFLKLMKVRSEESSDKQGVGGHEPPPP
jgi:hypothetical protein